MLVLQKELAEVSIISLQGHALVYHIDCLQQCVWNFMSRITENKYIHLR
jgi:hypothetical protein